MLPHISRERRPRSTSPRLGGWQSRARPPQAPIGCWSHRLSRLILPAHRRKSPEPEQHRIPQHFWKCQQLSARLQRPCVAAEDGVWPLPRCLSNVRRECNVSLVINCRPKVLRTQNLLWMAPTAATTRVYCFIGWILMWPFLPSLW